MEEQTQNGLIQLFENTFQEPVATFQNLPASGSNRRYCRMVNNSRTIIGAYNDNLPENEAFISFTHQLHSKGVAVPEIYAKDLDNGIYLLEDLGNETLFQFLQRHRKGDNFPKKVFEVYSQVVKDLAHLQIKRNKRMDYSVCYQSENFDKGAMVFFPIIIIL